MEPRAKLTGNLEVNNAFENDIRRASSWEAALQLVLDQVEQSMGALKLTKDPASKKTQSANVKRLLDRAERIKTTKEWKTPPPSPIKTSHRSTAGPTSRRQLSKSEQIILLKASFVNGSKYPPWQSAPLPSEFQPNPDGEVFRDTYAFKLSPSQNECLLGWKRARDALPPPNLQSSCEPASAETATSLRQFDLVQDAATDCSVVASLCAAAARVQRGCPPLLASRFYPYDLEKGCPLESPNGKYVGKLNLNGTFRRVEIDDTLPVSNTQRMIHILDRANPDSIWPALLEKMYLKVFGGYDFPGSNSGTDIWILFGWVPEQVLLGHQETSMTDIWRRIWKGHSSCDIMITLGTGKMSETTERHVGLASEHDYAVLDLREEDGQQLLLVKNPWCEGQAWRGSRPRPNSHGPALGDIVASPRDLLNSDSKLSPGTFWMDLHNVSQHFDSMYLNWNPALFNFREDIHFAWDLDTSKSRSTFVDTPQFILRTGKGGLTWLLLSRHVHVDNKEAMQSKSDVLNFKDNSRSVGYTSLSLFEGGGKRVVLKEPPLEKSPFFDSSQTLLQVDDLRPNTAYTVVPDQDGLSEVRYTFTLSVFAGAMFGIESAPESYAQSLSLKGSWTDDTAGGNADCPLYSQNPQYRIDVTQATAMRVLLETRDRSIAVNVKICVSNGNRMRGLRSRDIIADSKTYRPGCALTNLRRLDPGSYTTVCSTYEPGQLGDFRLRLDSDAPVAARRLANEGAGRFKTAVSCASFGSEEQTLALLLLPQRLTRFVSLVRYQPQLDLPRGQSQERSMIRVSVVQGDSFQHRFLASSSEGEYRDSLGGICSEEVDLSLAMASECDLWLVVERSVVGKHVEEENFEIEFYTDSKDAVQTGDWQSWEV